MCELHLHTLRCVDSPTRSCRLLPSHSLGKGLSLVNHCVTCVATSAVGSLCPPGAMFSQWNRGSFLNHTNCLRASCLSRGREEIACHQTRKASPPGNGCIVWLTVFLLCKLREIQGMTFAVLPSVSEKGRQGCTTQGAIVLGY